MPDPIKPVPNVAAFSAPDPASGAPETKVAPTGASADLASSLPALNTSSAVDRPGEDALNKQTSQSTTLSKTQQIVSQSLAPKTPAVTDEKIVAPGTVLYPDLVNKDNPAKTPTDPANPPAPTPPAGGWQYDSSGNPFWTGSGQPPKDSTGKVLPPPAQPGSSAPTTATDPYAAAALATTPFATTPQGQAYYDAYNKAATAATTLTSDQETAAEQAGKTAGSAYDALIAQAQDKAAQGKASNFVAAAKAGGLDSSAWVGIASLVGVPAGVENFEAMGGALQSFASAYDEVVTNLEVEKQTAIQTATQAYREYELTNNQKAYQIASDQFDKAKGIYDDQMTMNMNKSQLLMSYQDHLAKTTSAAFDAATTDVTNWAKSGVASSTITDAQKRNYELSLRLPYGSFDKYFSAQQSAAALQTSKDNTAYAKNVIDMMTSIPPGQSVPITMPDGSKVTYTSLADPSADVQMFSEDAGGQRQIVSVNKRTNQIVIQSLGASDSVITAANNLVKNNEAAGITTSFSDALSFIQSQVGGGGGQTRGAADSGPSPAGSDPSKVITVAGQGTYDFSTYATDPKWGTSVSSLLTKTSAFQTPQDISNYIKTAAPNSPITATMIQNAAQQYNVPDALLTAILQHESNFGTAGAATSTFNPGNVGNTDSGAKKNMGDWQSGVNAAAQQIAKRKIDASAPAGQNSDGKSNNTQPLPSATDEQAAQDLAAGRIDPSKYDTAGRSAATGRYNNNIVQRAEQINPNFNMAQSIGEYKFATNPQSSQAIVTINTVEPNVDTIIGLSDAFKRGNFPAINSALRSLGYNVGNKDVTNLQELQNIIGDELGKALAGNAALSDQKLTQALAGVNVDQSPDNFASAMGILKKALDNRKQALYDKAGVYASTLDPNYDPSTTMINVVSPDGTVGTIAASEKQAALDHGWKIQ